MEYYQKGFLDGMKIRDSCTVLEVFGNLFFRNELVRIVRSHVCVYNTAEDLLAGAGEEQRLDSLWDDVARACGDLPALIAVCLILLLLFRILSVFWRLRHLYDAVILRARACGNSYHSNQ